MSIIYPYCQPTYDHWDTSKTIPEWIPHNPIPTVYPPYPETNYDTITRALEVSEFSKLPIRPVDFGFTPPKFNLIENKMFDHGYSLVVDISGSDRDRVKVEGLGRRIKITAPKDTSCDGPGSDNLLYKGIGLIDLVVTFEYDDNLTISDNVNLDYPYVVIYFEDVTPKNTTWTKLKINRD